LNTNTKKITANLLRNIARYSLLVIGILVFVFALLSGSGDYGGGIGGNTSTIVYTYLVEGNILELNWELSAGTKLNSEFSKQ